MGYGGLNIYYQAVFVKQWVYYPTKEIDCKTMSLYLAVSWNYRILKVFESFGDKKVFNLANSVKTGQIIYFSVSLAYQSIPKVNIYTSSYLEIYIAKIIFTCYLKILHM